MKLTLSIDENAIRAAKAYAQAKNKSLSALTEEFYRTLEAEDPMDFIRELRKQKPTPDFDHKEIMAELILEKHK